MLSKSISGYLREAALCIASTRSLLRMWFVCVRRLRNIFVLVNQMIYAYKFDGKTCSVRAQPKAMYLEHPRRKRVIIRLLHVSVHLAATPFLMLLLELGLETCAYYDLLATSDQEVSIIPLLAHIVYVRKLILKLFVEVPSLIINPANFFAPHSECLDLGRNLPISFVQKYLMRKLDHPSESEVEVKHMGHPVVHTLDLHSYHTLDDWSFSVNLQVVEEFLDREIDQVYL
uniref:Uncharacterized protein n=1 Tax=Cucumis melo TaxID=3656 RepID=A0A9I9CTR2_CUCME